MERFLDHSAVERDLVGTLGSNLLPRISSKLIDFCRLACGSCRLKSKDTVKIAGHLNTPHYLNRRCCQSTVGFSCSGMLLKMKSEYASDRERFVEAIRVSSEWYLGNTH